MEVSQYELARLLIAALLCGIVMGAFYDLLRMMRSFFDIDLSPRARMLRDRLRVPMRLRFSFATEYKAEKRKARSGVAYAVLLLEDILFCTLCAVILLLLLYAVNDGQFRLSVPAVFLLGFGLYRLTLGRLIRMVSDIVIVVLGSTLAWIFSILTYPIALAMRYLCRLLSVLLDRVRCFLCTKIQRIKARILKRKQKAAQEKAVIHKRTTQNTKHYFNSKSSHSSMSE